uniref:Odorant receptor n=1 Tax=Phlebotomus papatasi TaxID=29031 RepID=A0A3F2ZEA5_PHLPP
MSVQRNLEIFNKIKPKIQFGISFSTIYVSTESLKHRILIKATLISTILCLVSTILHIANTFQGKFTGNLAMSLTYCFGCIQIISKTLFMRYNRNNLLELLDKVQSLHNNFENKELNSIAEKNLTKFSNIWETCFKLGKVIIMITAFGLSISSTIKGKSGIIIQIPLIPNDIPCSSQIMLFMQLILSEFGAIFIFYLDITIAFFGFEIMAASDILYEYISANKDRIQEDPEFLKILTIRYCQIVDYIKQFNDIVSIANLVQFVTNAFLSLAIFFFVRLYPRHPVGYSTAFIALFELFIPCAFGEFIKIKMERLSTTLYLTNWYDLNLKDQKSFLLVLGMTQREYGLRAAGMYDVNIYTFIKIVKMAISWCAFIFTMETVLDRGS